MKTGYACFRCGAWREFGRYLRLKWSENTPDRCPKCGAVHSVRLGDVDVISPVMHPLYVGRKPSPWQLWYTRPIRPGFYECRFTDTEPRVLTLWWNGTHFTVSDQDQRRVRMVTFLSWRGTWE